MHHHHSTKTKVFVLESRNQSRSDSANHGIFDSSIDGLLATIEARGSDGWGGIM